MTQRNISIKITYETGFVEGRKLVVTEQSPAKIAGVGVEGLNKHLDSLFDVLGADYMNVLEYEPIDATPEEMGVLVRKLKTRRTTPRYDELV